MHAFRWAALSVLVTSGCQSYSPAPVDLTAHARDFAERIPDPSIIRSFAETLRIHDPAVRDFDAGDGIDLGEARYVALLFNPALRTARLNAGVARASAAEAGRWEDPVISASVGYIMEQAVQYPWLAGGALSFTLPITGRPHLEKALAEGRHGLALAEARLAEADVLNRLDLAWVRWSAAKLSVALLSELVTKLSELEQAASRLAAAQTLTQIELRTFKLARVARQAELVTVKNALATLELDIKELLGMPPERPLLLVPTMLLVERVGEKDRRRDLLLESPRVTLAQRSYEVAERQLALAIRKQWPELTLQPGWQEEDAQPRPGIGFSLPLPLWNANAREIAETRASREAAAAALRGVLEVVTQTLARAEGRRAAAVEQRQLIEEELLPLAALQVRDARLLADLGQLDTLLILDAVTRAYDAQLAAVTTAVAEADATVEINSLFWPSLTTAAKEE